MSPHCVHVPEVGDQVEASIVALGVLEASENGTGNEVKHAIEKQFGQLHQALDLRKEDLLRAVNLAVYAFVSLCLSFCLSVSGSVAGSL